MNEVFGAALEVQKLCLSRSWKFCFIGALAVQRWGEPRLTGDVDLTLLTGFGGEEAYVDELLARFHPRREDARAFALRHRVVLVQAKSGIAIDVALGAIPFEERTIERASAFDLGDGTSLFTCSAEDLVVHKAFAGRAKDWLDIEGIAVRQAGRLDVGLVFGELRPLLELKGSPESAVRLQELLRQS